MRPPFFSSARTAQPPGQFCSQPGPGRHPAAHPAQQPEASPLEQNRIPKRSVSGLLQGKAGRRREFLSFVLMVEIARLGCCWEQPTIHTFPMFRFYQVRGSNMFDCSKGCFLDPLVTFSSKKLLDAVGPKCLRGPLSKRNNASISGLSHLLDPAIDTVERFLRRIPGAQSLLEITSRLGETLGFPSTNSQKGGQTDGQTNKHAHMRKGTQRPAIELELQ